MNELNGDKQIIIGAMHNQGYSIRKIAALCNVSKNTVKRYIRLFNLEKQTLSSGMERYWQFKHLSDIEQLKRYNNFLEACKTILGDK